MGHIISNSHLPYAIRLMARLQEQAAQTSVFSGLQANRLEQCAGQLRLKARAFDRNDLEPNDMAPEMMTQKVKLLQFLRQQK